MARTLSIAVIAEDFASGTFDKVGDAAEETGGKIGAAGKAFALFGAAAAAVAIDVGVKSVEAAQKFQAQMLLLQTQTGASSTEVKNMSKSVLALAGPLATAPDELATSLYHVESTGLRGAQALDVMKIAAEGAKVGHADLEETTNALTSTVVSGIPGIKNMGQAMGELNAIVGAGDMKMSDLNEALGSGVLTVVKGYGLSITDVGAALATFGDNNIRGADAATMLRMAVQAMAVPVKGGTETLAKLGIKAGELSKDMQTGGLNKALQDLSTHLKDSGVQADQVGTILTEAFGKKAGPGLAVLEGQLGRFETKLGQVGKGGDSFAADWTATTHNAGFAFDSLKSSLDAVGIEIGTVLLPLVADAATSLAKFFTTIVSGGAVTKAMGNALHVVGGEAKTAAAWIKTIATTLVTGKPAIGDAQSGISQLAVLIHGAFVNAISSAEAIIPAVVDGVKNMWTVIQPLTPAIGAAVIVVSEFAKDLGYLAPVIQAVTGFLAAHKVAVDAILVSVGAAVVIWKAWTLATEAWSVVTKAATAVQAAFDAVMDANPVMLVVIAIAALAAGLIYAYTHSKTFRDGINDIGNAFVVLYNDGIKPVADFLANHWQIIVESAIAVFAPFIGIPLLIITHWGTVTGWFKALPGLLLSILSGAASWLYGVGMDIINGLVKGVEAQAESAVSAVKHVGSSIVSGIKSVLSIASPSKVMQEVGVNLVAGMVVGITQTENQAVAAAKSMAAKSVAAAQAAQVVQTGKHSFQLGDQTYASDMAAQNARNRAIDAAEKSGTAAIQKAQKDRTTAIQAAQKAAEIALKTAGAKLETFNDYLTKNFTGANLESVATASSSTIQDLMLQTINQVQSMSSVIGPKMVSKLTTTIQKDNDQLQQLVTQRDAIGTQLDAANTALTNIQQQFSDAQSKYSSAVTGAFDISTAGVAADPNAAPAAVVTFSNMQSQLDQMVANAKAFGAGIQQLTAEGLNAGEIQQLAAAGPSALPQVQALLSATPAQLGVFNSSVDQLNAAGGSVGDTMANSMYGAGVSSAQGLVNGLASQQSAIEAQMTTLADGMVTSIKTALGIKSPSTVMHGIGGFIGQGLSNGIKASYPGIQSATNGMFKIPGSAAGSGVGSNRQVTINQYITGQSDPVATANMSQRRIVSAVV